MSEKTDKLLTRGLIEGFAGGSTIMDVNRSGFNLKSSHYEREENIYHDEWFADRVGGGQEIVKVGEVTLTRVYAGGTVSPENLQNLGISKGEVMAFLKKNLIQNGDNTRLYTSFEPESEGNWQYSYTVINSDKEIPLTVGKEVIHYKSTLVFVHDFIISPVD